MQLIWARVGLVFASLGACTPQLTGTWSVTGSCPAESKLGKATVTATANVVEVSEGSYRGTIINSFGQKGQIEAELADRVMTARTDWVGSGTTEAILTMDSSGRKFTGMDTEGCTLTVIRP